jgi:hypothetical protein
VTAGRLGVAVIGGGVAGTGAAFAASRAGASVVLVDGGPGASMLATGGLDLVDGQGPRPEASVPREVVAFLEAAGGYTLAPRAVLVTTAGVVRHAAGHDSAVIDVSVAAGKKVGVVECDRPGWNALTLARAWGERYQMVAATVLRHADERAIPDADFAGRHDDPTRLAWLGERLRDAVGRRDGAFGALVLPPCLGVEESRARDLSTVVGVPCGEATALPGGPAGLRFERTRERVLADAGVDVIRTRASSVERTAGGWRVTAGAHVLDVAAVVVATGGLLGGGTEYVPSGTGATRSRPPVRLTLASPLALGSHGRPLGAPSSVFGAAPERLAWPWTEDPVLERAGALVGPEGESASYGLFAAGEVVADAPRTWLASLASGLRAGAAAGRTIAQRV